jgi:hypothetical protein
MAGPARRRLEIVEKEVVAERNEGGRREYLNVILWTTNTVAVFFQPSRRLPYVVIVYRSIETLGSLHWERCAIVSHEQMSLILSLEIDSRQR